MLKMNNCGSNDSSKPEVSDEQPALKRPEVDETSKRPLRCMLQSWNLQWSTQLSVELTQYGIRVHIQKFIEDNPQSLLMTAATWYDLVERLHYFNALNPDQSFIANKQLLIFGGESDVLLQQMYRSGPCFILKHSCLVLAVEQVERVLELSGEITDCVRSSIFHESLPSALMQCVPCCMETHSSSLEEARHELFRHSQNELFKQVNSLFRCEGCLFRNPSQRRHACITATMKEKYLAVGEKAFFNMNFKNVAHELKNTSCICIYDKTFFSQLDVDDYLKGMCTF